LKFGAKSLPALTYHDVSTLKHTDGATVVLGRRASLEAAETKVLRDWLGPVVHDSEPGWIA